MSLVKSHTGGVQNLLFYEFFVVFGVVCSIYFQSFELASWLKIDFLVWLSAEGFHETNALSRM